MVIRDELTAGRLVQSSSRPGGGGRRVQPPPRGGAPRARAPPPPAPLLRQLQLQQVVAGVEQVGDLAEGLAFRQQPGLQAHQIQQVKFALGQARPVAGGHQQFLAHQRFGGVPAVAGLQADHEEVLAGQAAAGEELHGPGLAVRLAQPAGTGAGEALREIAQGQHPQFTAQALGGHQLPHHQQLVVFALPVRHANPGRCPR